MSTDPGVALANKSKAARKAARLATAGKAAFNNGKLEDALTAFQAAYRKDPKPKYLYNQGLVHSKLERYEDAIAALERYLKEAPDARDREKVETTVDFMKEKLEQTKVAVVVTSKQPGAALSLEGPEEVTGTTPWSAWLPPGRYSLAVSRPGAQQFRRDLVLVVGQPLEIEVDAEPAPPPAPEPAHAAEVTPDPPPEGEPPPPPPTAAQDERVAAWTWIALGVGVATLGASALLASAAQTRGDDYDEYVADKSADGRTRLGAQDLKAESEAFGVAAAVALAAGGVGVGLGGVMLVLQW